MEKTPDDQDQEGNSRMMKRIHTQKINLERCHKSILDMEAKVTTLETMVAKKKIARDASAAADEIEMSNELNKKISDMIAQVVALSSNISQLRKQCERSKKSLDIINQLFRRIDQELDNMDSVIVEDSDPTTSTGSWREAWQRRGGGEAEGAGSAAGNRLPNGKGAPLPVVPLPVVSPAVVPLVVVPPRGDDGVAIVQISEQWLRAAQLPPGTQAGQENMAKIRKFSEDYVDVQLSDQFGAQSVVGPAGLCPPGYIRFRVKVSPLFKDPKKAAEKLVNFKDPWSKVSFHRTS